MEGSKRKGLTIDAIFVTLCSFVVENYMSWEAGEGIGGMGREGAKGSIHLVTAAWRGL